MSILFKKALAPMVSRAMANPALTTRSVALMRPSIAVGMVRSYHRAHEDQSTILPNNIDTHKPEFKVWMREGGDTREGGPAGPPFFSIRQDSTSGVDDSRIRSAKVLIYLDKATYASDTKHIHIMLVRH